MDNGNWFNNLTNPLTNTFFQPGQQYLPYTSDQVGAVSSFQEQDQDQEQDEGEILEYNTEMPSHTPTETANTLINGRENDGPTTPNKTLSDCIFVLNVSTEDELRNLFSETDEAKIRRIVKRGKGWLAYFASPSEATDVLAAVPADLKGRSKYGKPNVQPAYGRAARKEATSAKYDPAQPLLLGIGDVPDSNRFSQTENITPNKLANEEKASRLRAKLIAMRANTPVRDKSAAPELISDAAPSTSTDVDNLVAQGRAAAAAANAAKATIPPTVVAHPSTNRSHLPGLLGMVEANHGTPSGHAQEQPSIVTNELREYQKLEQLFPRLQGLGETGRNDEQRLDEKSSSTRTNGVSEISHPHATMPVEAHVDPVEPEVSGDAQRRGTQYVEKDPERGSDTRAELTHVLTYQSGDQTQPPEPRSVPQATCLGTPTEKTHPRAYIKNVADHIELDELRDVLSKAAEIACLDINRQKQCAFVDFATLAQYQAALASNPYVLGGERLYVEDRYVRPDPTYRGVGAEDRLEQSRGALQNPHGFQDPPSRLAMEVIGPAIPDILGQPTERSSLADDMGGDEPAIKDQPVRVADTESDHDIDLEDWLELTGFHDEEFRRPRLERHRKLKMLKAQVAELEREAQLEGTYALRAQSVQPMEDVKSVATMKMAPPPPPAKSRSGNVQNLPNSVLSKHSPPPSASASSTSYKVLKSNSSDRTKRPRSPGWEPSRGAMPPEKLRRSAQDAQYRIRGTVTRDRSPVCLAESVRAPSPNRNKYYRARSASPKNLLPLERRLSWSDVEDEKQPTVGGRGQYEDRSTRFGDPATRRDDRQSIEHRRRDSYDHQALNQRGGSHMRRDSMNLRDGDVRYFLIKSWNRDNVEEAQDECVWATQEKNTETFVEAYNTCRHVVLVFSVNNSKAFQGYASMTSLPSPTVPTPRWVKALHWATSPPFYIRWHATNSTHFGKVGHLVNSFNEGSSVIVGRDGQEIEPETGARLCEILDEAGGERW